MREVTEKPPTPICAVCHILQTRSENLTSKSNENNFFNMFCFSQGCNGEPALAVLLTQFCSYLVLKLARTKE